MKIDINSIKIGDRCREDLGDDFGDLKKSIELRGLLNPILVNKKDYTLIAGFRRYTCCKDLGWKEIEVRFFEDLSAVEQKILELEENIHKTLTWKERAKIIKEIHELQQQERGAAVRGHDSKGWGLKDTAELLGLPVSAISEDLKLADMTEVAPEITNYKSRRQALKAADKISEMAILAELAKREAAEKQAQEGLYTILHGDALEIIKEKLDDEIVDLVIFDPPWGIDITTHGSARGISGEKTSYKDDSFWTARKLTEALLPELYRVLREDGHMYFFLDYGQIDYYYHLLTNFEFFDDVGAMFGHLPPELRKQALSDIDKKRKKQKWQFYVERKPLLWVKEGGAFTDFDYKFMPRYEVFLFCSKGIKKPLSTPTSDVFNYNRPVTTERIHTQEKPQELIERLIQLSTKKGDLVLDPCAGSFVTAAAATKLKRKSIAIDSDHDCYLRGLERLKGFAKEEIDAS